VARYAFHDLTLEVESEKAIGEDLYRLLDDISWEKTRASGSPPSLRFSIVRHTGGFDPRVAFREVLRTEEFRGFQSGDEFYLTDGDSLMRLRPDQGRAEVRLARSFSRKPLRLRRDFWLFGFLKLLRPMGIYGLHAAGLVSEDGRGFLVVGESGSGKSTLAIALIRSGWGYLSDEAVLLRRREDGVEALAFRRHFYVDGGAAIAHADLPSGDEEPDRRGGTRRRVGIEVAYPAQRILRCAPRVLLFPRIVSREPSSLRPIRRTSALQHLISRSGTQLLERADTPRHLELLEMLLRQTTAYELEAGPDLCRDPLAPAELLRAAEEQPKCLALSSS
jgi:hypothetical protein